MSAPTILIVDDDGRLASMLADYLGSAGLRTRHAETLAQARQ